MKYARNIMLCMLLSLIAVSCLPDPPKAEVALAGRWEFSNQTIGCDNEHLEVITAASIAMSKELVFFTNGSWQYYENDSYTAHGVYSYKGMGQNVAQPTEISFRRVVEIDYDGNVTYEPYHLGIVWNGTDEIGLIDLTDNIESCKGPSFWKRVGGEPLPATDIQ